MYKYANGAIPQPPDDRNFIYEKPLSGATEAIDWKTGFDIRNVLGGHMKPKNQYQSYSCVGQAWSIYYFVKNCVELGKKPAEIDDISAKAFYSQIFLPGGGAYISHGGALGIKWGAVTEQMVPSTLGDSCPESFVRKTDWLNDEITAQAKILQGKEYRIILAKSDMEVFARAIKENHGVVGGVVGQNGKGWHTERPRVPDLSKETWGHCIYYGAYGEDSHGRFIATPNSWGLWFADREWKPGDPPGYGWQKIYSDYFTDDFQFDPWTYTDKPNVTNMLQLVKGDKKPDIYCVGTDNILRKIEDDMGAIDAGVRAGLWESFDPLKHTKPQEQVDSMAKGESILIFKTI